MRSAVVGGWVVVAWLAAVVAVAAAPRRSEPAPPARFDDPCRDPACTRRALDGFTAALAAQRAGTAERALRIAVFGDSLIAGDHITGGLRARLGALIGAGGPGFVHAAPPHPYCQNRAVTRAIGGGWKVHGVSTTLPADRLLGLGGSAESAGGGVIRLVPAAPVATVDVHYLAQPRGGELAIAADGAVLARVATAADAKRAMFARVELPEATRRIELRAAGRVRLFGASLEAARGVVVDNLGVVNATAKGFARHGLPDHLRDQLARRAPDLVIVMLGTNEAEWLAPRGAGMTEHEQVFGELLASIRAGHPDGSCLVVSPLDQIDWRAEAMPPRASVPAMVDAQHRAATAHGCAFWDVYQWMGGKGASRRWQQRGLVKNDFQHPTAQGAATLAEALFAGLAGAAP